MFNEKSVLSKKLRISSEKSPAPKKIPHAIELNGWILKQNLVRWKKQGNGDENYEKKGRGSNH